MIGQSSRQGYCHAECATAPSEFMDRVRRGRNAVAESEARDGARTANRPIIGRTSTRLKKILSSLLSLWIPTAILCLVEATLGFLLFSPTLETISYDQCGLAGAEAAYPGDRLGTFGGAYPDAEYEDPTLGEKQDYFDSINVAYENGILEERFKEEQQLQESRWHSTRIAESSGMATSQGAQIVTR